MASIRTHLIAVFSLFFLLVCGAAHAGPANVSVAESSNKDGVIEVAVLLDQADAGRQPVLAEVFVEFDAKRLAFVEGAAGEKAVDAGKRLFAHEVSKGVVRFTLSGVNLRPLTNGKLAILQFSAVASGPARVALDAKRSKFAPKRAREGLGYGNPITIQVSK